MVVKERTTAEKWSTLVITCFALAVLGLFIAMGVYYVSPADDQDALAQARALPATTGTKYMIGVGIADVTGPAADVGMMGYAKLSQQTGGIHQRLYSRAYIVGDENGGNRFVFVSADIGMGSQIVRLEVLKLLEAKYPGVYTNQNVAFSGQHTHSGPGGYMQYLLYDVTTIGFNEQSFQAIVDGLFLSIQRAHNSIQPGYIYMNKGDVVDPTGADSHWANRNRSPASYEANPQEERDKYTYDVDKTMVLLKFVAEDGRDIGALNWFAVHPTSMNNTNHLISGDNKGYAAYLMERHFSPDKRPTDENIFVAAFAQSNLGDVTPNTKDPHCYYAGEDSHCDYLTSDCPDKEDFCVAFGPGDNMFESTAIIGERQYAKALELYEDEAQTSVPLTGPVGYIHQYVDMGNFTFPLKNGTEVTTCLPALGYSFAAGTIDGSGAFNFTQGDTTGSAFWDSVRDAIKEPTQELIDCHEPKPVLLPTGEGALSYWWYQANSAPWLEEEFRDSVKQKLVDENKWVEEDTEVVIAGLSNLYTHYVTTFEEYQIQRYEAASTIYGPHTLEAYQYQYENLTQAIATGEELDLGPQPPNFYEDGTVWGWPLTVIVDDEGEEFGTVLRDADAYYERGDRVNVTFQAGNPRNDLKLEDTFIKIFDVNNFGTVIHTDYDWCTRFYWKSTTRMTVPELIELIPDVILPDDPPTLPITLPENFTLPLDGIPGTGQSIAEIIWDIPDDTPYGKYRMCYYFDYKDSIVDITFPPGIDPVEPVSASACSSTFEIVEPTAVAGAVGIYGHLHLSCFMLFFLFIEKMLM
uniref:Neutral ceramidase n=1 Tax=Saccoglossus kowalevskii TaxID=10224 RepID=A0ABM0MVB5_SACKO|nr:PREDICTED: neutral ceramidase-like [Saccoglossus kowalevskii]